MAGEDRYEGKPFLRLIDSYVLWSMHFLDDASVQRLEAMEPKLNETFHRDGLHWYELVEAELKLAPKARTGAREAWQRAQSAAADSLDPLDFAYGLADRLVRDGP